MIHSLIDASYQSQTTHAVAASFASPMWLQHEGKNMYTTDKEYQLIQKQRAEAAIALTAKRYASKKRRIQELDYYRDLYQSFGNWQIAIDLLEEQMIAWGRVERVENKTLYDAYTEEMKHHWVDDQKQVWDDEDYQSSSYFRAYARARYAIRFMTIVDALVYLEEHLGSWQEYMQRYPTAETDLNRRRSKAYVEKLQMIVDEMRLRPTIFA